MFSVPDPHPEIHYKDSWEKIHETRYTVLLRAKIYHSNLVKTQGQILRGKESGGVWRDPCASIFMLFSSHQGSYRACPTPAIKMQQHMCNVSAQDSNLSCSLGFLLEAGHIGTLCLSSSKVQTSRRKVGAQNKTRLYDKQ